MYCLQVIVRSILSPDPERPIDDSSVIWSDEEEDETVDNLVALINANHDFRSSMFVGGLTKTDVDRMRECSKSGTKIKKTKQPSRSTGEVDTGLIASAAMEKIKPYLSGLERNISEASSRIDSMECSVNVVAETILKKVKEDLFETVTSVVRSVLAKGQPSTAEVQPANPCGRSNSVSANAHGQNHVLDANDKSIRNVIENISEYSTPPASLRNSEVVI